MCSKSLSAVALSTFIVRSCAVVSDFLVLGRDIVLTSEFLRGYSHSLPPDIISYCLISFSSITPLPCGIENATRITNNQVHKHHNVCMLFNSGRVGLDMDIDCYEYLVRVWFCRFEAFFFLFFQFPSSDVSFPNPRSDLFMSILSIFAVRLFRVLV